jgi:hypothetical protein
MNTRSILFLSCFTAVILAASTAMAAPHGGGHFASMPSRGSGRPFIHNGTGQWNGGRWSGDRHHRFHGRNDVIFISDFGFPFWGWGWGYPYSYYGYPYGYYPGGYNPYGYYGGGYDSGYNGYGYGYSNHSRVAEMQRRLAHAGYYHGAIDGIMGPQTRRALRAYRLDHGTGAYTE